VKGSCVCFVSAATRDRHSSIGSLKDCLLSLRAGTQQAVEKLLQAEVFRKTSGKTLRRIYGAVCPSVFGEPLFRSGAWGSNCSVSRELTRTCFAAGVQSSAIPARFLQQVCAGTVHVGGEFLRPVS